MRPKNRVAAALLVALFVVARQHPAGAQRNEASEMPEDCDQSQQYFDLADSKCRNCTDVMRIFEPPPGPYQEWQSFGNNNEPNTNQRAANNSNNIRQQALNQASDQTQDVRTKTDLMYGIVGSRLTPLPPTTTNIRLPVRRPTGESPLNAADAILSRLVLASQPSTEQSLAAGTIGTDEADDRDQTSSLTSASANPIANINQHEQQLDDDGESVSAQAQEQTNLAKSARQWQNLLWSFLQSNEIYESSLLDSIEQCRSIQNHSACQMWANMCVMTMYSHSESAFITQSQRSPSSTLRKLSPSPGPNRKAAAASRLGGTPAPTKTSWQQCAKFNLMTICNSLRDWRRLEKQAPDELGDIFGNEDAEGSLPPRLGSIQSSPLKLGQQIQVLAYEYAFDGRLISVNQFDLGDLGKFCLFSPSGSLASVRAHHRHHEESFQIPDDRLEGHRQQYIQVGHTMHLKCRFSALQANLFAPKHLNQTKFIDLFIGYQLNGAAFVKPVPILLRNLLYQGQLVNLKHIKDPTRWKFVHRYFPIATIKLGHNDQRATASDFREDSNNGAANQDREVLLFVRNANFEIKLRRQQDKGLVISSMLLILDYDHLPLVRGRLLSVSSPARAATNSSTAKLNSAKHIYECHIQVSQILLDMQAYRKDLDLFVTIICITSSIWTLIKCYNIQKYQGLIKLDIYSLCLFLVIACDIIANLLGLVTIAFALFLFTALKFQILGDRQQLLAPDDGLEQNLLLKLRLALILKLIGFLYKLTIRLKVDLFFIDWERPKMLTSTQIMSQQRSATSASASDNNNSGGLQASSKHKPGGARSCPTNLMQQQHYHQISFWRPYTIINRWLQIQTLRRQNLTLQLMVFISLVDLFNLGQLASSDPNLGANDALQMDDPLEPRFEPNVSPTFRALVLALVYVALALCQILYKRYIHEPMIKCAVREFVDLCSVGNVSLFSMLYPRYGFYVHGRNANGSGDCGIVEMNVLLEREERDICSRRGLLPNSDQQTFVLVLPKIINDHYRKLLFQIDYSQLGAASPSLLTPNGKRPASKQQQQQPAEFIRSALSLPGSLSPATGHGRSSSFGSMRALIEIMVARNRAINAFLINFLDHAYKNIDYSVKERRRFQSLLMEIDISDGEEAAAASGQQASKFPRNAGGGPSSTMDGNNDLGAIGRARGSLMGAGAAQTNFDGNNQSAATLFVDTGNSFASLIWLGFEWDLIAVELFLLLNIDLWLGPECLTLTVSLLWLINKLFQSIYCILARKNLITKSMLDEKFLI